MQRETWNDTVQQNVFVICKTPMAKQITQRTLAGYTNTKINAHYFDDLVNAMKNKPQQFIDRVLKPSYWKKEGVKEMKFDAIVGNPPYMEMDGGAQASARPIYQHFVQTAKAMSPHYLSFIMPTRWYAGGKGLDDFRDEMLNDEHLEKLFDCVSPEDIFPNTNIRGGVCYFLRNNSFNNNIDLSTVITLEHGKDPIITQRPLKIKDLDIFIRYSCALSVIEKTNEIIEKSLSEYISPRRPFGIDANLVKTKKFKTDKFEDSIMCLGKGQILGFIDKQLVTSHTEWINCWKVFTPRANNIGTELNDDNLNSIVGKPNTVCTESYIMIGAGLDLNLNSSNNLSKYTKTKYFRFMHSLAKASQDATAKTYRFVPLQDFTPNSDIDWSKTIPEIDKQLYAKYGLTDDEIAFIEEKIKPME